MGGIGHCRASMPDLERAGRIGDSDRSARARAESRMAVGWTRGGTVVWTTFGGADLPNRGARCRRSILRKAYSNRSIRRSASTRWSTFAENASYWAGREPMQGGQGHLDDGQAGLGPELADLRRELPGLMGRRGGLVSRQVGELGVADGLVVLVEQQGIDQGAAAWTDRGPHR